MKLFSGLKEIKQAAVSEDSGEGMASEFRLQPGDDERYMARALQLAEKGKYSTHPNPAVGCVIVVDGKIMGEGWHRLAGEPHAEALALKQAGKLSEGATLYVTLEPCSHHGKTPPCVKAIIKANLSRVVVATEDPNPLVNRTGISELQRAGIEVKVGTGQIAAKLINRGFLKRITTGIPWVTLKIATSLDGKTAMSSGESQWITSEPARQDAHKLRAAASGIMTGVGTVLRDNPSMNARLNGIIRQPLRIILDTNLSTPIDSKILHGDGGVLIVTGNSDENTPEIYSKKDLEVYNCPIRNGKIDLKEVLVELGRRQMNNILVEAGSKLSGSMLAQGLVDEVVLYMSPDVLGSNTRGMFDTPELMQLSNKLKYEYQEVVKVGRDLKIRLVVSEP